MGIKALAKAILSSMGLEGALWSKWQFMKNIKHHLRMHYPAGHFYSPIPSLDDVMKHQGRIFTLKQHYADGVDINEAGQVALLGSFEPYLKAIDFPKHKTEGRRYYSDNQSFLCTDAAMLTCFIQHFRPRRIVEVGSGFSSGVILDAVSMHLSGQVSCTFIEPYPEVLYRIISQADAGQVSILERGIQDVELSVFEALEAGDIFFVDSSHVSKVDSDLNRIMFEILPALKPGVIVHFHDIFHGFEYPQQWVAEGRAWNENYILRAFLQYNDRFEVLMFNDFVSRYHADKLAPMLTGCKVGAFQSGSIWLRKR